MNIMNSNCSIPNWNKIQRREEQAQEEGDNNHVASMSGDRMREFIWETESIVATTSCDDTLESIVDQAIKNGHHHHQNIPKEFVQNELVCEELLVMKKRVKSSLFSESGDEKYQSCLIGNTKKMEYDHNREEVGEGSMFDTTTTMVHNNVKIIEEDSATWHTASENLGLENQIKEETCRSHQTRSSRAAAIHKQSERKRRDRINQKMKALQKLVPNACKTDKASMLDEVIEYMKQLKAQVNLMMNPRNIHDQMLMMMMMMPSLEIQQQIQMSSLLATSTTSAPPLPLLPPPPPPHPSFIPFLHPSWEAPPAVAPPPTVETPIILGGSSWRANLGAAAFSNSLPYNEYYRRFLAQSMNMDLYNNMRALCTHQEADISQKTSSHQEANHVQRQL